MPRHRERRFFAVDTGTVDPDQTPLGGSPLPPLYDSAKHSIEELDFVIIAGEAEGYRSVELLAGGAGWTAIIAADAWIAVGPRTSAPQRVQIGPHTLEFPLRRTGPRASPQASQDAVPVVEFRVKEPQ
jgi:hypothetical protein